VAYRKSRGISKKEMANKLGVDPSSLANWERGERKPMKNSLEILEMDVAKGAFNKVCQK